MSVSLKALASSIFDASPNPNKYDLIDAVVRSIPESDREDYLREALRMLVPQLTNGTRRSRFHRVMPRIAPASPSGRRAKPSGLSAKRAMIRSDWDEFLSENLPLGNNRYIQMRDATVVDLRAAASGRRSKADEIRSEAQRWDNLADELDRSGARTLGDMPVPATVLS